MLAAAGALILLIAFLDWRIEPNISLGFLYLFPIILAAGALKPGQILVLTSVCAILRELLGPFVGQPGAAPRLALVWIAFSGTSLFLAEMVRFQRYRMESEEQLRALVESSPLAIFTLDSGGQVLLANEAAHRLLAVPPGTLRSASMAPYLPCLTTVLVSGETPVFPRSMMECRGTRKDGEVFLAHAWFSAYPTSSGPRLAAVVLDISDEVRDREERGLDHLLSASRIFVGAVLHEIRNLSGAANAACGRLGRIPGVAGNEDFQAVESLVSCLQQTASSELHLAAGEADSWVDLADLLEELRVIVEPSARDVSTEVVWRIERPLPAVRGDRHELVQACLNLVNNSLRAMEASERKRLEISAAREGNRVLVRVTDTGPGVKAPEQLFRPFAEGSDATGLGLYVSRAMVRSFGGDLRFEPRRPGCCFTIELSPARHDAGGGEPASAIANPHPSH